jgi:UDP-GlcNAc:undecaprenyl-phosphate GlcNAc-1-phosphate transferase
MRELLFFLEATLLSFVMTGAILRYSLRRSLLDMPTDRGSHEVPKPRLGGVAIVVTFYATMLTARLAGFDLLPGIDSKTGIFAAAAMIAAVGLVDDLRGLDAKLKLAAQIVAAAIVIASGVVLEEVRLPLLGTVSLGPAAIPLTMLWVTAIVNFYNFIDGLDGLAAGVGMIAAVFLVLLGFAVGDPALGIAYAAMAGVLFGFLRYNFPPARIFMGDCGSTFIGFLLAVLAIAGSRQGIPAFVTILLMGGVLADAALTLARRTIQRKRIFTAHRTHYYQRLTDLGLSHKQVTLLEYFIAALLGGSAFLLVSGENEFITGLAVIWTGFFLWAVFKIRKLEKGAEAGSARRIFAAALTDLALIAGSYVLSYMIRLNFSFPEAETRAMIMSLPIVIVIRTSVFYYYGLYKAVWRYTTFDDIVRIFRAVAVGSVMMVVLFTFLFRFGSFPRSAFLIDLFILTVFMAGARVATRWFHELPAHEEIEGRRIVIGETGHVAEAVLHRVKQTKGLHPVGWLDDRSSMRGRMIHGIPVLGSIGEIESIAAHNGVDEVVISAAYAGRIPPERFDQLERYGVPVRILGDLSDEAGGARTDTGPFKGLRVAAAGNGPVVRAAPTRFKSSASISVITDDLFVVRENSACLESTDGVYLGILEDRPATARIIAEISPEVIIADFNLIAREVSNPLEAYLRKVMLPLERLAAAAASSGSDFILLCRGAAHGDRYVRSASLLGESVVRMLFQGMEERLVIIRTDGTAGTAGLSRAAERLIGKEGTVWKAGLVEGDPDLRLLPVEAGPVADDISGMLMEMSRALSGGETERLPEILDRFTSAAGVEEHEHG